MVTCYVTKMITCSPMAGQFFGIMNVVSSDNEWLSQPINSAGNCFEPPKISPELTQIFAIAKQSFILFMEFNVKHL